MQANCSLVRMEQFSFECLIMEELEFTMQLESIPVFQNSNFFEIARRHLYAIN